MKRLLKVDDGVWVRPELVVAIVARDDGGANIYLRTRDWPVPVPVTADEAIAALWPRKAP